MGDNEKAVRNGILFIIEKISACSIIGTWTFGLGYRLTYDHEFKITLSNYLLKARYMQRYVTPWATRATRVPINNLYKNVICVHKVLNVCC